MELLESFYILLTFGILINLVGVFVFFISSSLKLKSLNVHEKKLTKDFLINRKIYICTNVSDFLVHVKVLTILIPGHHFLLSLLYTYVLFKHDGVFGVYSAFSVTEKWSAFPLVKINPRGIK